MPRANKIFKRRKRVFSGIRKQDMCAKVADRHTSGPSSTTEPKQGLDSEASNAEEAIKGECFPDMEDADDVSIVPEDTNNGISLQNKSEVLEGQSIEDSPSSMPKMVPNDTDIRNINTAEQDESVEDSCVCHNLSSIVQKLQSVSDKLVADSLCDSYDDFSKYISSLLRGLPKKKALNLKKKLVNDIIEVWLAHERDDQVSSLSETTPKKVISKQVFSRNVDHSRQLISSVTSNSQESTSMESIPVLISNQTTSLSHMNQPQYHNINIVPGADVPVVHHPTTITECESIRTVTSTANGTLLAITLPSRGSVVGVDVCRKPPPLISTRIKGLKRKRDSDESASKRVATMTSFPVADHSTAIINEDSECNSLIKPDGTETGYDLEDSKEISDINLSEELAEEHLDMILIKQEEPDPLEEDNEDVAQLFLCDLCLTHCPTK